MNWVSIVILVIAIPLLIIALVLRQRNKGD